MLEHLTTYALGIGAAGVVAGLLAYLGIARRPAGPPAMQALADQVRAGAIAFLRRESLVAIPFVLIVAVPLAAVAGRSTAVACVLGGLAAAAVGWAGMSITTRANVRTAEAARARGGAAARREAFAGGSALGLAVAALGLVGVAALLTWQRPLVADGAGRADFAGVGTVIAGFAIGAGMVALLLRVGGGTFAKAADAGADIAGKAEAGIPENDPRNPATFADHVGDHGGAVAALGADAFESHAGAVIATIALAATSPLFADEARLAAMSLPLAYAAGGLVASMVGIAVARTRSRMGPAALRLATPVATLLFLGLAWWLTMRLPLRLVDPETGRVLPALGPWFAALAGTLSGVVIGRVTQHYAAAGPMRRVAGASHTGPATNVIAGLALGMESVLAPALALGGTIWVAVWAAGAYGVAIAAVGMLATVGVPVSVGAAAAIVDGARGVAGSSHAGPELRRIADALDAPGHATPASGGGVAICSAALTALALLSAYASAVGLETIGLDLLDPKVLVGLLAGGAMPIVVGASTMAAVGRAAQGIVEEVRRQFRDVPGLLAGTPGASPDSTRCVHIGTRAALRAMVVPGAAAVLLPAVVGKLLGVKALGGLLAGATVTGVMMALLMAHAGGAWQGARRSIEADLPAGGAAHQAAVAGDAVGDPCKDACGPAMTLLVKVMSVVALVLAPWFLA